MDPNPIFQWIWRLNALVILAAALGTLGLTVLALGIDLIRDRRSGAVTVPTENAPVLAPERLVVGALSPVPGTPFLHAPVQLDEQVFRLSSYKTGLPARNVVFFDTRDGRSRRLLPDHRGVVEGLEFLPSGERDGVRRTATAVVFVARRTDANGDGVIDARDAGELMGAPVEGGAPVTLAGDVRALRGTFEGPNGASQVFFDAPAGDLRFVELDPRTLAIARGGAVEP